MIGAAISKLARRGAMNELNHRRKDKMIASYADDAVITYLGRMSVSGTRKGRPVVREFFDKHFDQFVDEHCVARETYIRNIFARGLSNTIAIIFHTITLEEPTKPGRRWTTRGQLPSRSRAAKSLNCRISASTWTNSGRCGASRLLRIAERTASGCGALLGWLPRFFRLACLVVRRLAQHPPAD